MIFNVQGGKMRFPITLAFLSVILGTNSTSAVFGMFGSGGNMVNRASTGAVNQIITPGDFKGLTSLQLFGRAIATQLCDMMQEQLTTYRTLIENIGAQANIDGLQLLGNSISTEITNIGAVINQAKSIWSQVAQAANNQITLQLMGGQQKKAAISQIINSISPLMQQVLELTLEIEQRINELQINVNAFYQQAVGQKNATAPKSYSVAR